MLASISFLQRLGALGVVIAVGTGVRPDSTRQDYGYGGVLPVPVIADDTEIAMATLPDVLVHRRTLGHGEKGRVLYAATRPAARTEPARTAPAAAHAKHACSQVVQARAASDGSPIS